jgi:hypothetical protein
VEAGLCSKAVVLRLVDLEVAVSAVTTMTTRPAHWQRQAPPTQAVEVEAALVTGRLPLVVMAVWALQ